jgi:glycosyltransferase involved in cell wall biosynthesis
LHLAFSVIKHLDFGGGIERYTRELATRLARRGHQVEVFSMSHYGPMVHEREGVRIVRVPCVPGVATEKLSASFSAAAACALRRTPPDLVHFHSVAAGAFAWLPHLRGIPCVLQMHGVEWQRGRWQGLGRRVLAFLERRALRQANALAGVSQALCDFYAREYGVHLTCITGGVEPRVPVPARDILGLGLQPRR